MAVVMVVIFLLPYLVSLAVVALGLALDLPLPLVGIVSFVLGLALFVLLGTRAHGREFATQPSPMAFRVFASVGGLVAFALLFTGNLNLLGLLLPVAYLPGYEVTALTGVRKGRAPQ